MASTHANTLENLEKLGFAFRLEGLSLTDAIWEQLSALTRPVAESIRPIRGISSRGLDLWIHEISEAPDAEGWVRGHRKVKCPYWYPKSAMDEFSALQSFLDKLAHK